MLFIMQHKRNKDSYCQQCGYQYIAHCKCNLLCYRCQNGHEWMKCPTHKNRYVTAVDKYHKYSKPICDGKNCLRASYHYTNVNQE